METVNIQINAKDNASPQLKKIGANLKEMGANISQVGMKLSAAFTLPIVGMAALVLKSKEVQAVLQPVRDEFAKIGEQLGTAFVPLIKEAVPSLLKLAGAISGVITWFSNLDPTTKKVIVGFLGFVAAIGPVVLIVGQIMTAIGSFIGILGSLGLTLPVTGAAVTGFVGALGPLLLAASPIIALAAAIGTLLVVLQKFGPQAWTAAKQLLALTYRPFVSGQQWLGITGGLGLTGKASGGSVAHGMAYRVGEMGGEIFRPSQSGNILPAGAGANGGGASIINFTYSPVIGIGSEDEMYKAAYRLDQALRRRR